ncbi:Dehydrogenase multihelical [Penicillium hispanicum]|uniref:Dehydrogenase multihelical n=1 Tax=Penicillium hispanicum TaxID=1080232 RepID=UPI0025414720|nr:Dehydrogenase multihelical [Penicillium hispanicum]KAJ5578332.1 Dehydrogenase multihelical [Penicillium hispanicum]
MSEYPHHIALLGVGTIGLSMLALHLRRPDTQVTIYDPRPDYESLLRSQLPHFLDASPDAHDTDAVATLLASPRLALAPTLHAAVHTATIIQEQTPEHLASKQALWTDVARSAPPSAHLWSSSSGIPASAQAAPCDASVAARLLVAHPFNPPHVMPLVEIVPGPHTAADRVAFAAEYFAAVPGPASSPCTSVQGVSATAPTATQHYRPITLHKEVPGFVGNRLAFALLREACSLVGEGVVSARDLDALVVGSLGPRWAGSGVFESYHAGGGEGGIGAFLQKLAPTVKDVWADLGQVDIRTEEERMRAESDGEKEKWREMVVRQTEEAYGSSTSAEQRQKKDRMLRGVIELQKRCL